MPALKSDMKMITLQEFDSLFPEKSKLSTTFSSKEMKYCEGKQDTKLSFMGKLCAKRVVQNVVNPNLAFTDIEVDNADNGKPQIWIKGKKQDNLSISISHSGNMAVAFGLLRE